ncbi:MAG: 1-(5-phosphoribosyl)-5-[(5-phosphoribosylamino)methylideneamino]imidazole-4-carboxamide isomerase [Firmicutes bacterium]|nr:1-(5-phosphoribosyl)-5-[(5-phosphoribosylamino)methylideneamino]imidazole-4-carboxamide isomerase [Bacillota bacterium]
MLIIPAIDLRRGCCVRLLRGDPRKETVYSDDPVNVALEWEKLGARYLHIIDLDGAFSGQTANARAIERVAARVKVPFQLGGGIRNRKAVEDAFELGVTRVIVGTMAISNPELLKELLENYGERIVVGIDAREGKVAVRGWQEDTRVDALELARKMEEYGVREIIYTDINRDGALMGPNLEAVEKMASATSLSIIVAGGVTRVADLVALKELQEGKIKGAIIGKALYDGQLTLADAFAAVNIT